MERRERNTLTTMLSLALLEEKDRRTQNEEQRRTKNNEERRTTKNEEQRRTNEQNILFTFRKEKKDYTCTIPKETSFYSPSESKKTTTQRNLPGKVLLLSVINCNRFMYPTIICEAVSTKQT